MAIVDKRLYGGPIAPGAVGPRQVPSNPTSKAATPPIQIGRFCRNGKHPSAQMWASLNESANQAALYRSREHFSCYCRLDNVLNNPSTSDRDRWRFAFRTGPYQHAIFAVVLSAPTNADLIHPTINTQCRLTIYSDTAEATAVSTSTFTYGAHPNGDSGTNWGFQHMKVITATIEGLTADTEYYAKFTDVNVGRVIAASVFDLPSLTEGFDGYLNQSITAQTGIVDTYRQNVAELQRNLWKRSGAKVLTWTVDDGTAPETISSGTLTNVIDGASTSNTASSAGFTLDMRNKDRVSQTSGIPVVMKVCGKGSAGAGGSGVLKLVDSSNNAVTTITDGWSVLGPTWQSVSFNLPATQDKYDLQFSAAAGTFSLYAVSIWEHET